MTTADTQFGVNDGAITSGWNGHTLGIPWGKDGIVVAGVKDERDIMARRIRSQLIKESCGPKIIRVSKNICTLSGTRTQYLKMQGYSAPNSLRDMQVVPTVVLRIIKWTPRPIFTCRSMKGCTSYVI